MVVFEIINLLSARNRIVMVYAEGYSTRLALRVSNNIFIYIIQYQLFLLF